MGKQSKIRWAKHQKAWWGKWHLYLGIFAGLIIAVVGVTGSILVFQDEIDRELNKDLFEVMAQSKKIPLTEIVPMIREKYPDLVFEYIMDVENKPNRAYHLFNFATEEEIFVNPYTAEISGKRIHESSFIHIVTEIHRTLLVPVVGRYIVGFSSLILLILTITGMRLWIPQKWKQLKQMLTVKFSAGFKRQNYDWHNVIGFYSAPVVSLLALTGFCITFSLVVVPLLFLLSGESPQGVAQVLGATSTYTVGAKTKSVAEIARIGNAALPDARVAGIAFPADSVGNYRLDMMGPGLPKSGKREMLILDQYSGKILLNSRTDFPNVGNAYLSWLTPIHYGSFGGRPTQILALIGGLVPLALFITGFIIWWPRFKKQRRVDMLRKEKEEKLAAEQKPALSVVGSPDEEDEQTETIVRTIPQRTIRKKNPRAIPEPVQLSQWKYFLLNSRKGFIYAGWFVLIGGIMGALYGVASGIVIEPAVFTIVFCAVLAAANFVVALVSVLFNLVFLAPFNKSSRRVVKYFAFSWPMTVVFVVAYAALANTGLKIF